MVTERSLPQKSKLSAIHISLISQGLMQVANVPPFLIYIVCTSRTQQFMHWVVIAYHSFWSLIAGLNEPDIVRSVVHLFHFCSRLAAFSAIIETYASLLPLCLKNHSQRKLRISWKVGVKQNLTELASFVALPLPTCIPKGFFKILNGGHGNQTS